MGFTEQVSLSLGFLFVPPTSPEAVHAAGVKLQKRRDPMIIGGLVRALYHGKTLETRLAAVEVLSRHRDDQVALHHAAFHDPDLIVRVAAARNITREDLDPLIAMSEDPEVRLAFVQNTQMKDILVAMGLCDPDETVKSAATEALQARSDQLRFVRDDARTNAYYDKFRP